MSSGEAEESTVSIACPYGRILVELNGRSSVHIHWFVRDGQGDPNAVCLHAN